MLDQLAELRSEQPPQPQPMPQQSSTSTKLCTIEEFVVGMLGFKHRVSYYNNKKTPGWPQMRRVGTRPMLLRSECEAYIESLTGEKKKSPPSPPRQAAQGPH